MTIRYNIKNKRFGKLVAIKHLGSGKWLCECDCGNTTTVPGSALRSGNTSSCGCLRDLTDEEMGVNILYSRYKVKAEKREIEFNLSKEVFTNLVTSSCQFCGQIPNTPVNYKGKELILYNGIDRVKSDKTYNDENCVTCCWVCNRAKGNLSVGQFRRWLKQAYTHQYRKHTELTPGQLIDSLFTVDYKCWWAQEFLSDMKNSPEERAEWALKAQELNAKRTKLIRTIDQVLDFTEDTNTEKTYANSNS